MKKLLFLLMLTFTISLGTHAQDSRDKMKKTETMPQKVHNTMSRHKKHKGYKIKHHRHGVTHKRKVDYKNGDVKTKSH